MRTFLQTSLYGVALYRAGNKGDGTGTGTEPVARVGVGIGGGSVVCE